MENKRTSVLETKKTSAGSVPDSRSGSRFRLAICGTRGIPACYGGFETFAEELATRLVERGHDVVVYGRRHVIHYTEPVYRGVEIRLLPAPRHKYLETPVHSLLCFIDLLFKPVDVVLVCNAANSPFIWVPRLRRMPVLINVDGIERMRAKWNAIGRLWYKLGERCSVLFANAVISDADVIRDYYLETYKSDSAVIRYGHIPFAGPELDSKLTGQNGGSVGGVVRDIDIAENGYLLYVSRLEPENNAHVVIAAYNLLPPELKARPLVIVGDAPYAKEYIASLHAVAGEKVIFCGYRFGADYRALQRGAYLYIQATEVGGTHPALVEAMGFANCILANDTLENREVVGPAGLIYARNDERDLARLLTQLLNAPEEVLALRRAATERAQRLFSWDQVADQYEALIRSHLRSRNA